MTAYYNEHDPFAAAWLRQLIEYGHIAPGIVDERSIEDVTPADLDGFTQCHFFAGIGVWSYALRSAGWSDDTPIWTGSCPCQPFSAAGKGAGFDDERHLWPAFHWLISQCRPAVVVGEQVASKDGLAWLDLVQSDLEITGYASAAVDMCAAGIGAPHIRQRLWWFGVADAERIGRTGLQRQGGDGLDRRIDSERSQSGFGLGEQVVRLDDTVGAGLEGFRSGHSPESGRDGTSGHAATTGESGGMADAQGTWRRRREPLQDRRHDQSGGSNQIQSDGRRRSTPAATGPTNGFWRNADWLYCRDGRWRAVEPIYVKVVNGITTGMGRMRDNSASVDAKENKEKVDVGRVLPELLQAVGTQEIQRSPRRQDSVPESEILRSDVHGGSLRRTDQGSESQELQAAIGQASGKRMRGMQQEKSTSAQPSSGRKSDAERPVELDYVVRSLSLFETLAKQRSDNRTATVLFALRQVIAEKSPLLYAHFPIETVWASLGEKEKDEIRLDFDAARWVVVAPFPLAHNVVARVGRLRGYGNAIVAQNAATFIEAVREVIGEPTT